MARRMPRVPYYLVYSVGPPAADVIKGDLLIPLNPDDPDDDAAAGQSPIEFDTSFKYEESKDKFVIVKGKILDRGFKKYMLARKVSPEGLLFEGEGIEVGTRKQEKDKIAYAQNNAKNIELHERAKDLMSGDPGALDKHTHTVLKHKSRLPTKRTRIQLEAVRTKVDNLECLKRGHNKTQIWAGKPIYLPSGKLTVKRLRYAKKPRRLFSALLKMALPVKMLIEDGFSATGTRYCAGPPEDLIESLTLYVGGVYQKAGGTVDMEFDPTTILTDLISNTRRKHNVFVPRNVQDQGTRTPLTPLNSHTPATEPDNNTFSQSTSLTLQAGHSQSIIPNAPLYTHQPLHPHSQNPTDAPQYLTLQNVVPETQFNQRPYSQLQNCFYGEDHMYAGPPPPSNPTLVHAPAQFIFPSFSQAVDNTVTVESTVS